jgi:2,3-bisphosphoglycerate-independent phosphoglycerate mutase
MPGKTPYVLIILDGWGHREEVESNAIKLATTPTWDRLCANQPHCLISGSGLDVGLPDGQMGNSEVGHMNLGAGRVIDQDFTRITKAIDDRTFFDNPTINSMVSDLVNSGNALHIFGLLSPGGVHSHEDHLKAAVALGIEKGVSEVYLHAFLDGRDVPPKSAAASLEKMQQHMQALAAKHNVKAGIASIIGRYYAMDRDNRWDRVEQAFNLIVDAKCDYAFDQPVEALQAAYDRDESDEFVNASSILIDGKSVTVNDGDGVLFMNFRADRARELSRAFVDKDFSAFTPTRRPKLSQYVTLTQYAESIDAPSAFEKMSIQNSLGEYIASLGKRQLRLAETEKYAHVTFFFSGGRENEFEGETRKLIPSPDVATYDLQPTMSAPEVTDELIAVITSGDTDLIVCNYANGDMVGHTGNLKAAIEAVECLDQSLSRVVSALNSVGGHCLITADHGNVEMMNDHDSGQAHTAHTSERVPLVYVGDRAVDFRNDGTLSDVSPTLLSLMDLEQPKEMTGRSLFVSDSSPD